MNVGRIKLYLLDTDNDMNSEFDRPITHSLYGGDWENRLKQEILLGIGGMLALKKMGIKKDIYHCNEGHAALCNLQRLCDYIEEDGLNFNQALSWFALLLSILFILQCQLVMTTLTRLSSASTWWLSTASWYLLG